MNLRVPKPKNKRLLRYWNNEAVRQFVRFCIVGVLAAGIHYGIYYLLQFFLPLNVSYTVGYLISLVCNFFLTAYVTFRRSPTFGKAFGFGASHLVNYLLHIVFFNMYLYLGVSRYIAPIATMLTAMPVNFLILQWVFMHKKKETSSSNH